MNRRYTPSTLTLAFPKFDREEPRSSADVTAMMDALASFADRATKPLIASGFSVDAIELHADARPGDVCYSFSLCLSLHPVESRKLKTFQPFGKIDHMCLHQLLLRLTALFPNATACELLPPPATNPL